MLPYINGRKACLNVVRKYHFHDNTDSRIILHEFDCKAIINVPRYTWHAFKEKAHIAF